MNKLLVIARYDENLDWVNEVKHSILIYNKGLSFPYNFPRIDVPNRGREAETYLRAIIENYNQIEQFSHVIFLQGCPHDHYHDNLMQKIDDYESLDLDYICESIGEVKYKDIVFSNNISLEMIRCLLSESYSQESGVMKCVYLLSLLGINSPSSHWKFSCGAQYIVPVNMIKSKSLDWWKNIYRIYDQYIKYNPGDPGLLFEFIWPLIWTFEENKTSM